MPSLHIFSGPASPIVVSSGIGNVHTAVGLDGGEPEVHTGHDLATAGLTTDSPRKSNVVVWTVGVYMQVLYLFPERLLLPPDVMVMVRSREVLRFNQTWKTSQTTPALAACISESLHGMLLVGKSKVTIRN